MVTDNRIIIGTAVNGIFTAATPNEIKAVSTQERIIVLVAINHIMTVAAFNTVCSAAAIELIITVISINQIVTVNQGVSTNNILHPNIAVGIIISVNHIIAKLASDHIMTVKTVNLVSQMGAVDDIAPMTPVDSIRFHKDNSLKKLEIFCIITVLNR